MPVNDEKPAASVELLHQLLGEYIGEARRVLELRRAIRTRFAVVTLPMLMLASLLVGIGGLGINNAFHIVLIDTERARAMNILGLSLFLVIVGVAAISRYGMGVREKGSPNPEIVYWQLRKVYEMASRRLDHGHQFDPVLELGISMKLVEAEVLLQRLEDIVDTKAIDFSKFGDLPTPRTDPAVPKILSHPADRDTH